ncbi:hypothetical protein ABKN59_009806 [Abortiporus biennis]
MSSERPWYITRVDGLPRKTSDIETVLNMWISGKRGGLGFQYSRGNIGVFSLLSVVLIQKRCGIPTYTNIDLDRTCQVITPLIGVEDSEI